MGSPFAPFSRYSQGVIVGGAFSGLHRARVLSESYVRHYAVIGCGLFLALSLLMGGASLVMILVHLLSVTVVWPASVATHLVALRAFRARRVRETWRVRVAAWVAVPLVWGGAFVWGIEGRMPRLFSEMGSGGIAVYCAGVLILLSNLALLVAWILPSHRSPDPGQAGLKP